MFASRFFNARFFTARFFATEPPSISWFTASPGGLFRRIGRATYLLNSLNSWRGSADLSAASIVSLGTGIDNIAAQYDASNQSLVDNLYSQRDAARMSLAGLPFAMQSLVTATVTTMIDDLLAVNSRTISVCMALLVEEMENEAATVNANAVSASVEADPDNTGTAAMVCSVKGPDGRDREYVFAEEIRVTCATQAQDSTATAGSESWSVLGELAQPDSMAHDWPLGSGAATSITAIDAAGSNNRLANGDFEDFTSNTPDNWTIVTGSAGTTVLREATEKYAGSYGLEIVGNGSELTSLTQSFNQSSGSGSTYALKPSTVYAVNCWIKVSSVPAAGVLAIDLIDGDSAVTTDDEGTSNAISQSLTAVLPTWQPLNGFFRTPAVLPSSTPYKLRVRLSTALTSGVSVFIDHLSFALATQVYAGGPYVAIFSGATNSVKGDLFTVTVANDWGGKFQKAFERFFGMRALGLQLPSDAASAETILDSLVA